MTPTHGHQTTALSPPLIHPTEPVSTFPSIQAPPAPIPPLAHPTDACPLDVPLISVLLTPVINRLECV